MASDAVGSERISRIVGYKITTGDFSNTTPNLPQRIVILGEANTANQGSLPLTGVDVKSAQQAGETYGFGSPIHMAMRILRPVTSDGVGGIPTIVFAQAEAGAATNEVNTLTVTGTATASKTHTVVIAGREGIDGASYDFEVVASDTPTLIAAKINDVLSNVVNCPFTTTVALGVVTLTSKWKGATASKLTVSVNTNDDTVGVSYAVLSTVAGTATPTVTSSLNQFGEDWNTLVVNTYDIATTAVLDELEAFNGIPDPTAPTGRYAGITMKPFIAVTGSTDDENTTLTDARKDDVTIAVAPAPLSQGMPLEAAANMVRLFARIMQDKPHLDVSGRTYPDMPTPLSIGTMAVYNNRDSYVKLGNSTVTLTGGKYKVEDFVTTYHPLGEFIPQFRYCRNLMIDFNVRFGYFLLEQINVIDHAIANNDDLIAVGTVVKPKQWVAILNGYAADLGLRALIVDVPFFQNSLVVNISGTNPDRFETFFRYKRSGFVRIAATTAEAGFNFGTN